ncbi:MAG: hypothetical protein R3290_10705, partial [Acidimicrobiia bacterium]|nr:hypothetical protein [Acidimicrobiia bacterium]
PATHHWESRVYQTAGKYSADEAEDVTFGGLVRFTGKIPFFDQLGDIPNTELTLNQLTLEINTITGTATATSVTTLEGDPAGGGGWVMEMPDGSYDPDTGEVTGTFTGTASGGLAQMGLFVSQTEPGVLTGTVDLSGGRVDGIVDIADASTPFFAEVP